MKSTYRLLKSLFAFLPVTICCQPLINVTAQNGAGPKSDNQTIKPRSRVILPGELLPTGKKSPRPLLPIQLFKR
ncbi:MAG: hypothetical protein M3458_16825 [Acidobacteriota bacterium]|nr:hypothetical protein [Acidobacteriota bacterium]